MKRVAVVGGGLAGCAAARALSRSGREVVLFEAGDQLGGRARSWHRPELVPDTGINLWFTNFYRELNALIDEYSLRDEIVPMKSSIIGVSHGKRAPLSADSPMTFVRYPFLGWRDKLKLAAVTGVHAARRRDFDLFDVDSLAKHDDGSVAEWATSHMSEALYQFLVRPSIESFWLFDTANVSSAHASALQAHAAGAKFYVLRSGMEQLAQLMMEGIEVRPGHEVIDLESRGDGFQLSAQCEGGPIAEPFDEVVLATTAQVAAKLAASLPDQLVSARQRDYLVSQEYVPALSVSFLVEPGALPRESHMVPVGPGQHATQGIISVPKLHTSPDGVRERDLVFVYPGRASTLRLLDAPAEVQFEEATQLARDLWPDFPADPQPFHIVSRRVGIPIPSPGRFRQMAEFVKGQRGPIAFAGDYLGSPTAEGALRSGGRAAAQLTHNGI